MKANDVRRAFTDFFVERDHSHQPSASLIPHDPTVLFTVAGMVPFKAYLTGEHFNEAESFHGPKVFGTIIDATRTILLPQ